MAYSPSFLDIVGEIDRLMVGFSHSKKDIGYGYRRTFPNGQRVDMIDYRVDKSTILRVGRGAQLVRKYPLLHGWFDELLGVIGKIRVADVHTLHEKNMVGVLILLSQMPKGLKVFD